MQLGAVGGEYKRLLSVKCYSNPCGQLEAIDWRKVRDRWEHLKYLPLSEGPSDQRVRIIIGTDCMDAIKALAPAVLGKEGKPCTKITKLGWIVGGRTMPLSPGTDRDRVPENIGPVNPYSGAIHYMDAPPLEEFWGFMHELTPDTLEQVWASETPKREKLLASAYSPAKLTTLQIKAQKSIQGRIQLRKGSFALEGSREA